MNSESQEQVALVEWFRLKFPDTLIFAVPNGGWRHKATAARMKAEGVIAGVPDLFVPEWRLWIEMKRSSGGKVSTPQTYIMARLRELGYTCLVCRGAADAVEQIDGFVERIR